MNDLQRRVQIIRETSEPVPCEVVYFKDTEAPGEGTALWNAANDPTYCQTQAEAFIEQLEGWGWSCEGPEAATSSGSENSEP